MKTYMGVPGDPPTVTVVDSATGQGKVLVERAGWGKGSHVAGAPDTALAILMDHLGGDEFKANKLRTRVMWRVLIQFQAGAPWTLTGASLDGVLEEIAEAESGMAAIRQAVDREPAPIAYEGGVAGGVPVSTVRNKG